MSSTYSSSYTKNAMDKRLHITTGTDLVNPSSSVDYFTIHETVTGSSGRQVHVLAFLDETLNKEFQCTFMCPHGTDPATDYTTVYYDGTYEIRAVNDSSNYTRLYLYSSGSQIAIGSHTISNVKCNSYTAHS